MADDHLAAKLVRDSKEQRAARRRWNCPPEEAVAAYVEGSIGTQGQARIESHLAKCEYCCGIVADVIKLQRAEPPDVPADLVRRAIALGVPVSRRLRWVFLPAATTAAVTIAVVVALMFRGPEQQAVSPPTPPAAPLIAKSAPEPAPTLRPPAAGVVRNSKPTETLPQIVSPKQDKVVARDSLTFVWKPVLGAQYYELHVVTPEGGLVWEGQSEADVLALPSDVSLDGGPYFVWVSAYLNDGRVQKSAPVRFLVSVAR